MTRLRLGCVAWIAGMIAYLAGLVVIYGEVISGGGLRAVLFTSWIAFMPCYWLLYLPVLGLVRRLVPPPALGSVGALVATLLGLVPTLVIARLWGGSLRSLLAPEAVLFYVLFTALGIVIGFGYAALPGKEEEPGE